MAFLSGEQKEPEVAAHILGRVGKQIIGGGWGGGGTIILKMKFQPGCT